MNKDDTSSHTAEESHDDHEQNKQIDMIEANGPWYTFPIINSLPDDIEVTVIESYDEHVYIGTTSGEILHYFEIEFGNYLLVSRTNFEDRTDKEQPSVNKIIILPKIEKACILSDSEVVLFLLPEMAPVPNVERMKGINDVILRNLPKKDDNKFQNKYELLLFKDENIRNLIITENEFKERETFDYKFIETGQCHNTTVMTSKLNNYELLNLKYGQVTPLFRISEAIGNNNEHSELKPIIRSFDKDSFLVCSGGSTYEDNAMVLVVNHRGDITGMAMELEHYPINLVVNYPYLLVQFRNDKLSIYKFPDDDSATVQEINGDGSALRVFKTQKTFKPYPESTGYERYDNLRKEIIDKLSLQLISGASTTKQYDVAYRNKDLEESFDLSSPIVLVNSTIIYAFIQKPLFLTIKNFEKSQIQQIKDYLANCQELNLKTKMSVLERNYLTVLYLLLNVLHCDKIDIKVLEEWCDYITSIDIRLFLDLLGFKIYGKLWIYNGLKSTYDKLKAIQLRNKSENTKEEFLKFFRVIKERMTNLIVSERNNMQDYQNIVITVDVLIFTTLCTDPDQQNIMKFDILKYDKISHDEIIRIAKEELLPQGKITNSLLIMIFEQKELFANALSFLKSDIIADDEQSTLKAFKFIKKNLQKLPKSYLKESLVNDLSNIMENLSLLISKYDFRSIVKDTVILLKSADVDSHLLLKSVEQFENGIFLKVTILEEMGIGHVDSGDSNDNEFLVRYYVERIHSDIVANDLWGTFTSLREEYKAERNYDKLPINSYLRTKMRNISKCKQFLDFLKKILNITKNIPEVWDIIKEEISKFDKDNILLILFFFRNKDDNLVDHDFRLKVLIENNAYSEIQQHINDTNLAQLFDRYCNTLQDVDLGMELLKRNRYLLDNNYAIYISILEKISKDTAFCKVGRLILSIAINHQTEIEGLEMKKSLLKNEVSIYNDILKNLDT
ncbi:hypothetical protein C6P45_002919 [Maudiozyma exigua]|uniref:CNH domain-containing protein n=1 Tax=Maudiozyma exigua TaxID=34358 RepID=A0A9P7B2B3_MAUEX|nr:hypothetical protein C6P45_002919 [Kazachstania exigua]